jgi:uncharacterized protein with HEPN domain
MKYSGWDYLDHMVQTCEELAECMQGIESADELEASVKTRRAVTMCLLDLGELFTSLGDEERNEYPSEHWHRIIGFRNRSSLGIQHCNKQSASIIRFSERKEKVKRRMIHV